MHKLRYPFPLVCLPTCFLPHKLITALTHEIEIYKLFDCAIKKSLNVFCIIELNVKKRRIAVNSTSRRKK